jgi:signal transduction histidine kinase
LLRQVLAGRPPSQLELIITRATGDLLPVNVSAATFPDDAGRIGGIVINLMDLSERKALERLVITAGVEEQQRLGAELHDGLGQQLTGLALLLSAAANKVRSGSSNGLSQLEEAAALARSSVESCRQIAHGMSPLTHTQGDLLDALGKMAKTMNKLGGPAFRFIAPCDPLPTLQPEAKDHLYRIAQEACANAQRHAAAKSVTIGVEVTPTVVRMFVEDDGTGLSDGHRMTAGLGLKSMHYRASLIGASLDVRSGSRHGTRIECDVAV